MINIFQAPKNTPPLAKQNLILAYLQKSLTAHTIKELEKTLPGVASINGMQVKDYLQALSDEGKIHVEKIGSGNWYWSFASEEKKNRESIIDGLKKEQEKLKASVAELEAKFTQVRESKGEDEGRADLVERQTALEQEVETLKKELEGYKDTDPGEVDRRRKEVDNFKAMAEMWTDNIGILEGKLKEMLNGDSEQLEQIKRDVYDDDYVEGEGLKEL